MAHASMVGCLGLLLLASGAAATTVGPVRGRPVAGQPLQVNIPFAVDEARDRACASAMVRDGGVPVPRSTLHVQGQGLKRNLLVTSRANVSGPTVTIQVRVGCGRKAVTHRFVLSAGLPAAKSAPVGAPIARQRVEPVFPPRGLEAVPQESSAHDTDASTTEELRKARADAATAIAQLEAARKELAAVLDVERRTSQTLIDADHQVRDAKSEVAHMRLVLKWIAAGLGLAAAGVVWLEFDRIASRLRTQTARPPEEPTIFSGNALPT
jgi:hypothetical protein